MSEDTGRLQTLFDDLKRLREELAVQIHLGKAEAKDEWARLEKKWDELRGQMKPATDVAGDTARGIGSAFEQAAKELKTGYERFRKLI
jgi:predicted nuclease with TOPRIM domain